MLENWPAYWLWWFWFWFGSCLSARWFFQKCSSYLLCLMSSVCRDLEKTRPADYHKTPGAACPPPPLGLPPVCRSGRFRWKETDVLPAVLSAQQQRTVKLKPRWVPPGLSFCAWCFHSVSEDPETSCPHWPLKAPGPGPGPGPEQTCRHTTYMLPPAAGLQRLIRFVLRDTGGNVFKMESACSESRSALSSLTGRNRRKNNSFIFSTCVSQNGWSWMSVEDRTPVGHVFLHCDDSVLTVMLYNKQLHRFSLTL